MTRVALRKKAQNSTTLSHICHEGKEPVFPTKKDSSDVVIMCEDTYKKNLFLSDVYAKLGEAQQDLLDGKCSPIENAVSRIRQKHGL